MRKTIKVTVKYVPNILEEKGRVTKVLTFPYDGLTSLYDLLDDIKKGDVPDIPEKALKKHKVIVNGRVIEKGDWKKTQLRNFDEVILTPEVKEVITMAVVGGLVGWGVGAGMGLAGMALFNAIMLGFSLGGVIGGFLFAPNFSIDANFETPTYSWNGQSSYVAPGDPLPIVYGQLRVPIRIVNSYVGNEMQYDQSWDSVTPTNQVNSGLVNSFRMTGSKLKLFLNPMIAIPQAGASIFSYFIATVVDRLGVLTPANPQNENIRKLKYVSPSSTFTLLQRPRFLGYEIEYKKAGDSTWTSAGMYFPTLNIWIFIPVINTIMMVTGTVDWSIVNPFLIEFPEHGTYDVRMTLGGLNVDSIPVSAKYWLRVEGYESTPSQTKGDNSYLNVLGVVSEGEVDQLDISTIEIDGNPISNYDSSTLSIYTRLGTANQDVINGFRETHTYQSLAYNLRKQYSTATQTTTGSAVEGFVTTFTFAGLYHVQNDGDMVSDSVTFSVEWKLHSASTWESEEVTISAKQQSQFTKQFRKENLSPGQYDVRITRLSVEPSFTHITNMMWTQLDEFVYADIKYPYTALVGIRILATDKLSGSMPNITILARGRKVLQPKILDSDSVELGYDEYYYDAVEECYKAFKTYTLLDESNSAVSTLDTSYQLKKTLTIPLASFTDPYYTIHFSSSSYPANIGDTKVEVYLDAVLKETHTHSVLNADIEGTVADLGAGTNVVFKLYIKSSNGTTTAYNEDFFITMQSKSSVATWDGATWVTKWTANPIWIMYDLFRTDRPGISDYINGEIYTSNLEDEAKYCDTLIPVEQGSDTFEKRFRMDVCIDAQQRAADLLKSLASTFRAYIFTYGGQIKLIIDREGDVVQKFTMGNIRTKNGKSTFKSTFASLKSTPNMLEVQYFKNGERDVVIFEDSASLAAGDPIRKQSLNLMLGVTRTSQALRMAKYYLYLAKYCARAVSFGSSLEAITASCGDVISIQHDVTGWGYGGRCATGSTTTVIKLDGTVILAAGTTYEIIIQFADDTIERRDISTGAGSYTQVTASSAFSQTPAKYDKWEIVTKTLGEKKFRVIDISRDDREDIDITALEYNESIYDDITGIVLPTPNYSLLRKSAPVSDLVLSEDRVIMKDGTISNAIAVYFNKPTYAINYGHANIYLSTDSGVTWELRGQTKNNFFLIQGGIAVGTTYTVGVASVTKYGEEISENLWESADLYFEGKLVEPEDVTAFIVALTNDRLEFSWDAVSDTDIDYYEIRRGYNWDTGTQIARTKQTQFVLFNFPYGTQNYFIKARDTSGNYSLNSDMAIINITSVPGLMKLFDRNDPMTAGTLIGSLTWEWNEMYSDRFRKCALITTQNLWDDSSVWDDGTSTWDYPVSLSAGYYTLPVEDIGLEASAVITLTIDSSADSNDATYTVEERHSTDNITWTSWTELGTGSLTFRYIQLRVKLVTTDENKNIRLFNISYFISQKKITEHFANQSISSSGTTINFTSTFHTNELAVNITPVNSAYKGYATNITKTSCKVYLTKDVFELDGNGDLMPSESVAVSGTASIVVAGF